MGICTSVIGFKPKNEKYFRMKAIYDACAIAHVTFPKEVKDYFGDYGLDDSGVVVDSFPSEALKDWASDGGSGIEVDLSKLPDDIKVIRFVNRW